MKQISGFPAKMEFTPLPNYFLSAILPHINDINELKTTLQVISSLYRKKGYPQFVSLGELLANRSLMSGFIESKEAPASILRQTLEMATGKNIFLHITMDKDGTSEDIYLLNTASNRQAAERIKRGELPLPGLKATNREIAIESEEPSDIFMLYEQNIGMLTPIIAEELKEAEKLYPTDWIRDAIKEAAEHNKRNWSYISAILENWLAEGRSDGTYWRGSKKKQDPNKYIKGKYGHMVQR